MRDADVTECGAVTVRSIGEPRVGDVRLVDGEPDPLATNWLQIDGGSIRWIAVVCRGCGEHVVASTLYDEEGLESRRLFGGWRFDPTDPDNPHLIRIRCNRCVDRHWAEQWAEKGIS